MNPKGLPDRGGKGTQRAPDGGGEGAQRAPDGGGEGTQKEDSCSSLAGAEVGN